MRTMRGIEGPIFIFIVVSLLGIFVFWMNAIRHDDVTPTLERLIEAGYTMEEILQHPDVARINRRSPGLLPNIDEWPEDDLQRARNQIETLPPARAATAVLIDAYQRQTAHVKKQSAVLVAVIAFREAHRAGVGPFTVDRSLPASVRAEVEEAFGEDAETVLTQIEEAFSTRESATRVSESDGGIDGYVNQLLQSLSAPADD